MAEKLDAMPHPSRWSNTIPYCLWGDEGTLNNSSSWMFGTLLLAVNLNVIFSGLDFNPLGCVCVCCVFFGLVLRMFDLSPFRTNSRASRYILYSLPVSHYCFDDEEDQHINITLQSILQEIVTDLNGLSTSGLEVDGEAMGLDRLSP